MDEARSTMGQAGPRVPTRMWSTSRRCGGWGNIPAGLFKRGTKRATKQKQAARGGRPKRGAARNRQIFWGPVGGAAGTVVPGIGTVIGAIVGAGVGFASSKEKKEDH